MGGQVGRSAGEITSFKSKVPHDRSEADPAAQLRSTSLEHRLMPNSPPELAELIVIDPELRTLAQVIDSLEICLKICSDEWMQHLTLLEGALP